MPFIPKSEINESGGLAAEGWHLVRINRCDQKRSKDGELMYNWSMVDSKTREFIGYDVIMLEGKGNGIGIKKLLAIGLAEDHGDGYDYAEPSQCDGTEAWAYIYHDTYSGKKSCKVDISFGSMGYQHKSSPPIQGVPGTAKPQEQRNAAPGYGGPATAEDDGDIPF